MDEADGRWEEPARAEVEGGERLIKVDVQPLAPRPLGVQRTAGDQLGTKSSMLFVGMDLGIEKEGVVTAVPGDVGEADQDAVLAAGGDPAKT